MYQARYEKPPKNQYLFVTNKDGNIFPSKAVAPNRGVGVPLDRPYQRD